LPVLAVLGFLAGCENDHKAAGPGGPDNWEDVCIDEDRDTFGTGCEAGRDCDDSDSSVHVGCDLCKNPNTGCVCEDGAKPVDCVVSRAYSSTGSLLCKTGQRFCRDSAWTECIGVRSYEVPEPQVVAGKLGASVIDPDAAPVICDPCRPDCYRLDDFLEVIDANDPNVTQLPGGGITLVSSDTSGQTNPDDLDPTPDCTPGVIIPAFGQLDDDCDGIPDNYDTNDEDPPFATNHATITMDLDPGQQGSNTFELEFFLNTVDVYFLIDTTASMDGELDRLVKDLTTGSFLDDPSTAADEAASVVCASPPGTTTSDATLKTKGIAGNIACLVPDSGFGAGHFREIPFAKSAGGYAHGYDWILPYQHRQDISTTVDDTLSALKKFYTAGNISWPEADIFALQAVASGGQIYTGWDRAGVPARTCPSPNEQFGWPCFRKRAVPVIVLITDATMVNGPNVDVYDNDDLNDCAIDPWQFGGGVSCSSTSTCTATYGAAALMTCQSSRCTRTCTTDAQCAPLGTLGTCYNGKCIGSRLPAKCATGDGIPDGMMGSEDYVNYLPAHTNNMSSTPDGMYHPVAGNETFTSAYDVGSVSSSFKTYTGNTRGMAADIYQSNFAGASCREWPSTGNVAALSAATPGYPDAVFKFSVTDASTPVTISTRGSHHAPTLAIVPVTGATSGVASTTVSAPASSDTTPWSVPGVGGSITQQVNVDLTGFTGAFPRESFGACMSGATGATDYAPDAVFAITPTADLKNVRFTTSSAKTISVTAANSVPGEELGTFGSTTHTVIATGTTSSASNKWDADEVGTGSGANCYKDSGVNSRQHIFHFTLASSTAMTLSLTTTSNWDAVLSLFGPRSSAPTTGSTIGNATTYKGCSRVAGGGETLSGTYAAGEYYVVIGGYEDTYDRGSYTLTVAESNASDEAIAVFDQAPVVPQNVAITGPSGANTNDVFYDFNVGTIDNRVIRLTGGDTAAAGIHGDYFDSGFAAASGGTCNVVSGVSNDAVVDFSVATTRRVRVETFDGTGLESNMGASFDHVVALIERPVQLSTVPIAVTNNDSAASAHVVSASSVPTTVGAWAQFTGDLYATPPNTLPMSASIDAEEMYLSTNADTVQCSAVTSGAEDVVYRFDVDATSAGRYDFDTNGSSGTTFLSVHKGSPDTFSSIATSLELLTVTRTAATDATASDTPAGAQLGFPLGTVDSKTLSSTSTTTANALTKWTVAQYGGTCRAATGDGHEHVYSFVVGSTRDVRITLASTAPYDGVVRLHKAPPVVGSSLNDADFVACSRATAGTNSNPGGMATVDSGVIAGSLAAGTYYLVVHGYDGTDDSGFYTIAVEDAALVTRTIAADNVTAAGDGRVAITPIGDIPPGAVSYDGATSISTTDKWTRAQALGGGGSTHGCRATGNDHAREHVLSFTVPGAVARNLSISLSAAGYDASLSILRSTAALNVRQNVTQMMACSRKSTATAINWVSAGYTASAGKISGSFAPGTYYVMVYSYATDIEGTYTLTIADNAYSAASVAIDTTDAAYPSTGSGSDLTPSTTLTGPITTTGGATTNSSGSKWTRAQLISGSTATHGCRASTSARGREHLLKFTTGAVPRNLRIQLTTSSGTYDPSLSVFSDAPVRAANTGSLFMACSRVRTTSPLNEVIESGFTAGAGVVSGTFAANTTYYLMVHAAPNATNNTTYGAYTVTIEDEASVDNFRAESLAQAQTGVDLGVANDALIRYAPGNTATTSVATSSNVGTINKWTAAQLGGTAACMASASANTNREHVFKFEVTSSRSLKVALTRSGTSYDAAISIFDTQPVANATLAGLVACSRIGTTRNVGPGFTFPANGAIQGTFATGTYYVVVHATNTTAANQIGSYSLSIDDLSYATSVTTVDSLVASSSGPQGGLDLGTVDGKVVTYTGTTSTSTTPSKWKHALLSTGTTNGCRQSQALTATHEHVLKFTVDAQKRLSLRVKPSATSYEPSMTVLSNAPVIGSDVAGIMACSRALTGATENQAVTPGFTASNGFINGVFDPGTYYVVIHASRSANTVGTYKFEVMDTTPQHLGIVNGRRTRLTGNTLNAMNQWTGPQLQGAGGSTGTNGGRVSNSVQTNELVYQLTLTQATTLKFSTTSGDAVISLFGALPIGGSTATGGTAPSFAYNAGGYETLTRTNLPAGEYWLVVHGYTTTAGYQGPFTLEITDDAWDDGLLGCDSRGTESKVSNVDLVAGNSYYVVIKGQSAAAARPYKFNVRRSFNQPFIACDHETLGTRRSFVEATLEGGKTYSVVVRGVTAANKGTYGLLLSDLSAAPRPLTCANAAGYSSAGTEPAISYADLQAGKTYYVAVRANSASSVGVANVVIESAYSYCAYDTVSISANTGAGPAEITRNFSPGEYYAVIKGTGDLTESSVRIPTGSTPPGCGAANNPCIEDDRGRGWYQLTIGNKNLQLVNQQFNSPLWGTDTAGVYQELLSRGVRVITVNSTPSQGSNGGNNAADPYLRAQSITVSSATGALDTTGAAVRRTISPNGAGMGFAVVDAVARFTEAVQMDISVRLTLAPDDPGLVAPYNRRFAFTSRAVAVTGNNGCAAPIDTNSDGMLDTFQACGPGATPRFEITLTNPEIPNNVPFNQDAMGNPINNGGYLMRLELVGKDLLVANAVPQIVDTIPVFVIPAKVFPDPNIKYETVGTYTQDVKAAGCTGANEAPVWKALYYSDTLPVGTSMEWRVCGGDTAAELEMCDDAKFVTAAYVTPGDSCTQAWDCPQGYCNAGRCENPVGPSCTKDADCGNGGACASSKCVWTTNPTTEGIDLKPAVAKGFAGKKQMRVQVKLKADATRSFAPKIHDFRLDYLCTEQE
jgi:hypothetical protein